jgi:hypothetical protein
MKSTIDAGTTLGRTFRNAGSRDHGHHKIAKRSLAWRERSEGKRSLPLLRQALGHPALWRIFASHPGNPLNPFCPRSFRGARAGGMGSSFRLTLLCYLMKLVLAMLFGAGKIAAMNLSAAS